MQKGKRSIRHGILLFTCFALCIMGLRINTIDAQSSEEEAYQKSRYSAKEEVHTLNDEQGNSYSYTSRDIIEKNNGFDIVAVKSGREERILAQVQTYEDALAKAQAYEKEYDDEILIKSSSETGKLARSTYQVVKLKQIVNAQGYAMYANVTDLETNNVVGISWSSLWDCAYLRSEGDYHIIRVANMIGKIHKNDVDVIPYTDALAIHYYKAVNGRFFHYISTDSKTYSATNQVGYQPSYIKDNTKYFSYDGKYFYTSYEQMIQDYQSNHIQNSVNANQPYYNYFQYLPHRSYTNFTATQMNDYVKAVKGAQAYETSKLNAMGASFIENQNIYGTNAILMYGVAINESGWGLGSIAQTKNNLFGHGAVDSNPDYAANGYPTPAYSIKEHASSWVHPYANPLDWRYHGSILGTKASGMNVMYATDPYWGEKAASQAYGLENYYGNQQIDYKKYILAIAKQGASVYKDSSTAIQLYAVKNTSYSIQDASFILLDKVSGQSINGNNIWYKVASDVPLNDTRSAIDSKGLYDATRDYGYVHSSQVQILDEKEGFEAVGLKEKDGFVSGFTLGMNLDEVTALLSRIPDTTFVNIKNANQEVITNGIVSTGMYFTLQSGSSTNMYQIVIVGDVNGDGVILANDYFIIKKYKEQTYDLKSAYLQAADVNRDGSVLANDYFMIKKYKEGQYDIIQ